MVYDQALGMLLWRRVLDKDCQLISTGWYLWTKNVFLTVINTVLVFHTT
jgi:hypothetical protein